MKMTCIIQRRPVCAYSLVFFWCVRCGIHWANSSLTAGCHWVEVTSTGCLALVPAIHMRPTTILELVARQQSFTGIAINCGCNCGVCPITFRSR